jgi:chromosome segregation ATPase
MTTRNRFLIILVIASLGLWGCAQGPASGTASAERLRALENKLAKVESDFRSVSATRDQLRKKLTAVEDEKAQLAQQVEQLLAVVKERDSLRKQLTSRTAERDTVQSQFDAFRKGIKSLLGQAELSASALNATTGTSTDLTAQKKS